MELSLLALYVLEASNEIAKETIQHLAHQPLPYQRYIYVRSTDTEEAWALGAVISSSK